MIFPYPKNPKDWQTAYTRGQAHRQSQTRLVFFFVPLILFFLASFLFAYVRMVRIQSSISSDILYRLLALIVVLVVIAIFVIGLRAAFQLAGGLLEGLYQPPGGVSSFQIILYRLIGRPLLPPPLNMLFQFKYILAKDGQMLKKDEWPAWMTQNMGGPILLIVFDGTALYLERGKRFSRVVGPGKNAPFLELHETIKYVVDYRPTVRTDKVTVWTKDGIQITVIVRLECQIGAPRSAQTEKDPPELDALVYRYDPLAIKKAVERNAVRRPAQDQPPTEVDWVDNAWGQVTGFVPNHIGARMLDDLLLAERENGQILSPDAARDLFNKINESTQKFGVYVTNLQFSQVIYPPEVEEQRRLLWEAERQGTATVIDGQAKASSIRSREEARAEAQKNLIVAIADGLEKNKSQKFAEPLLLSLSGILDNSLQDPLLKAYLAKETMDMLEKLQKILERPA